jgi:hypothetical protein
VLVYGEGTNVQWTGHSQIMEKIANEEFEGVRSIDDELERKAEMEVFKAYCDSQLHRLLLHVWFRIPENRALIEQRTSGSELLFFLFFFIHFF